MEQAQFSRIMAGEEDPALSETWFLVTIVEQGELAWEERRCTLDEGAAGFRGGRHRGSAGLRLSFYEAAQTENCSRYRAPCTDFAQISGDVVSVDKSRARIAVEKRIVRDIENERGAHLDELVEEWFATTLNVGPDMLRMLAIELHHLIKWKMFDAYTLSATRVKRGGGEVYELLNVPDRQALRRWMRDWVRYTFAIISPRRDVPARRVARAARFIEENLDQHIRVRDVAEHLHMDAAYFSRVFKREMGVEPSAYILRLRLDRAHAMLRAGRSVGDAAQAMGFSDVKAFRRAFVQRFHVLPSHARDKGRYPQGFMKT